MVETKVKTRYPAAEARRVADEIVTVLSPHCERIEIAGSLRRRRAEVGDVEILYIPRMGERQCSIDMFRSETYSMADDRIERMLYYGDIHKRLKSNGTETWGRLNKLAIHGTSGIPVDFFASTLENWWVSLVVRTGSARNNLNLTTSAQKRGCKLLTYSCGVQQPDQSVIAATSEQHVFALCGVRYLEPHLR